MKNLLITEIKAEIRLLDDLLTGATKVTLDTRIAKHPFWVWYVDDKQVLKLSVDPIWAVDPEGLQPYRVGYKKAETPEDTFRMSRRIEIDNLERLYAN